MVLRDAYFEATVPTMLQYLWKTDIKNTLLERELRKVDRAEKLSRMQYRDWKVKIIEKDLRHLEDRMKKPTL